MKTSNTVVSAIVIAAVLIFAYGVGLLIRQARTGSTSAPASATADKTSSAQEEGPRAPRTKDTPEARARAREKRAQMNEKMASATDEEKAKFRKDVTNQFRPRRDKGPETPPVNAPRPAAVEPVKADANATASNGHDTKAVEDVAKAGAEAKDANTAPVAGTQNKESQRDAEKAGAEPNKAGPG